MIGSGLATLSQTGSETASVTVIAIAVFERGAIAGSKTDVIGMSITGNSARLLTLSTMSSLSSVFINAAPFRPQQPLINFRQMLLSF